MTSSINTQDPLLDTIRAGAHQASAAWGWIVALGALWIGYGIFVLSYQAGSLAAVAALVAVAFLLGGTTQLMVAARERTLRWLNILGGILGLAAAAVTLTWPGITLTVVAIIVAAYLIAYGTIHIVTALAGPKLPRWWTGLLFGTAELVLGIWAATSWQSSLLTLVTLVGVWAISRGINEIIAGNTLRQISKQTNPHTT